MSNVSNVSNVSLTKPTITPQPVKSGKKSSPEVPKIITTQPKRITLASSSKYFRAEKKKADLELKKAKDDIKYRQCCWWGLTGNLKTHQFIDIYLERATRIEHTGKQFLTEYGKMTGNRISYLLFDRIAAFILCFGSKNTVTRDRDYYGWYFPKVNSVWADGESVDLEDIDKKKVTRKREKELEEIMVYSIEEDLLRVDSNAIIELIGKIEYLIKNPNYKYDRYEKSEEGTGRRTTANLTNRLNVLKRQINLGKPYLTPTPTKAKRIVKRNIGLNLEEAAASTSKEAASTPKTAIAEGIKRKKRTKKKRKPKRKKTKNKKKKPKRKTKQSNN